MPDAPPPSPDQVLRALGMCIVRGELDEADGQVINAAGPASATA
jgi:hypothetical protein